MRALSESTWGANRELMLTLYTVYIQPKMMYGISAVASACTTRLDQLEKIQNAAIRLAIGARNTSPRVALQVEADIPPLSEYIQEMCCRTYFRMSSQEHPLLEEMVSDDSVTDKVWTAVFKQPFVKRCLNTLQRWDIPVDSDVRQVPIPRLPPWEKPPLQLVKSLPQPLHKDLSNEEIKAIATTTINTDYRLHFKIYTDGSKYAESTSAAMWIPCLQVEDK